MKAKLNVLGQTIIDRILFSSQCKTRDCVKLSYKTSVDSVGKENMILIY